MTATYILWCTEHHSIVPQPLDGRGTNYISCQHAALSWNNGRRHDGPCTVIAGIDPAEASTQTPTP